MRVSGRNGVTLLILLMVLVVSALPVHADSTQNIQTVDDKATNNGVSIALDSDNKPHLCYIASETGNFYYEGSFDPTPKFLTYTSWNGSNWNIQTVDPVGTDSVTLEYNSLALDSNDTPHIVYSVNVPVNQTEFAYVLKYATLKETEWTVQTIDFGDKGVIEIDSEGNPHLAYSGVNGELKYATLIGSNWFVTVVDSEQQSPNSGYPPKQYLTLDKKNTPLIIYSRNSISSEPYDNLTIKLATRDSSVWKIETVVSNQNTSTFSKVALGTTGYPLFVYTRRTSINTGVNTIILKSWDGSAWNSRTVGTLLTCEKPEFLELDSINNPRIIYYKEAWEENGTHSAALIYTKGNGATRDDQIIDIDYTEGYFKYQGALPFVLDSKGNPHVGYLLLRETVIPTVYYHSSLDATVMYATSNQPVQSAPLEFLLFMFALVLAVGLFIALDYCRERKFSTKS